MKQIKHSYIIIFCLTVISCTKLNLAPTDNLTASSYYTNEQQLNAGLTGVYDVLGAQSGYLYADNLLSQLSAGNDEYYFVFNEAPRLAFPSYRYGSNDFYMSGMWNELYRGVNNANAFLEALDSENAKDVSPSVKEQMRAQALFLRAYFYFMLVDRWGGVPMPLTSTKNPNEVNRPRIPAGDVFLQIVKDMEVAEAILPQATVLGANSSGRISKNTVQGILARVNLAWAGFPMNNAEKYAEALKWSKKVMDAGDNSLNPNYIDLFVKQARDEYYVKENMWEVEFYGNVTDLYREQGFVGVRNGVQASNGNEYPGYGYNFIRPSIPLFNLYQNNAVTGLSNDLRRERNFCPYQWVGGSATSQIMTKSFLTRAQFDLRWPGKWRREEEIKLPRFRNGNGTNFPILRYSDVLLMFAEAENQINGPTAAAYNALNLVRQRAYGTGYKVSTINVTNGGSGYTAVPLITIANNTDINGSASATATASVANGRVTAITIVTQGAFYTNTPPVVTIAPPNTTGTQATATATMLLINPTEANLAAGLVKDDFFKAIVDERSKELAFEALRTQDLRRWNLLIPKLQAMAAVHATASAGDPRTFGVLPGQNIDSRHLLWPIPASEAAYNRAITQNPGW